MTKEKKIVFFIVGETEDLKPMDRRKRAIMRLEERRQARLRDSGVIGVATSRKIEPDYRISVRRVNFRWQRGLKIGMFVLINGMYILT